MQTQTTTKSVNGTTAFSILLNDHHIIKRLLAQLTQVDEPLAATQTLEQLRAALTIHNATEENVIYPAISQVAGKHMTSQHLYHETAAADMLMFEIDELLRQGDLAKMRIKAETLQAAVTDHIQDEEESAFPVLQRHCNAEQAKALTESVQKMRSSFHFEAPVTS
jgi:hemerythrin superfamily protein